jgi:hypothetical protein
MAFSDPAYFTQSFSHVVPCKSPFNPLPMTRIIQARAYGTLIALHICYLGYPPPLLSPFVLVVLTNNRSAAVDISLVDRLVSDASVHLQPWQELNPHTVVSTDLLCRVQQLADINVSPRLSKQNPFAYCSILCMAHQQPAILQAPRTQEEHRLATLDYFCGVLFNGLKDPSEDALWAAFKQGLNIQLAPENCANSTLFQVGFLS